MNAKTLFGGVVLALVLSMGAITLLLRQGPPKTSPAEAFAERPHNLAPLWPAPDFAFPDQHGATVTPKALAGAPYVANFIFTQCKTVCPLLTAKMVQLQRQVPGVHARFLSFSVDPAHDTPQALEAYARQWNAAEPRWTLLSTSEATLPGLVRGFHVTADKAQATPTQPDPIIHSTVFLLIDGSGMVRGAYDSEHRQDFDALVRDLRVLAQAVPDAPPATARSGEVLYHELSCVACHERPELAPSLRGLAGHQRELSTGALVRADATYLRESIVAPDAQRVRGYPLHMPTYDGLLTAPELDSLVAWVEALPAPEARDAGPQDVALARDPVCHMEVRATPDALRAEFDGGTYFFCAEICRDRFQKAPAAFLVP